MSDISDEAVRSLSKRIANMQASADAVDEQILSTTQHALFALRDALTKAEAKVALADLVTDTSKDVIQAQDAIIASLREALVKARPVVWDVPSWPYRYTKAELMDRIDAALKSTEPK